MRKMTKRWALIAPLFITGFSGCTEAPDQADNDTAFAGVPGATTDRVKVPDGAASEPAQHAAKVASIPVKCGIGEAVLFSCKIKGGKQLSVCGTNNNGGEPFAQYRFGKGNSELTIDFGEFSSVPYSGGGEAQIAFTNGDTRYIVFSRIVRTNFNEGETNDPEITDGVMVVQPGKKVASILCEGGQAPDPVDIGLAESYGGAGSEIFHADE